MFPITPIISILVVVDFVVHLLFSVRSGWVLYKDGDGRDGLQLQRWPSWCLCVMSTALSLALNIWSSDLFMRRQARNFDIAVITALMKMLGDACSLIGLVWHWRILRSHATRRSKRWVIILAEMFVLVWTVLVVVRGITTIKGYASPPSFGRFASSTGSRLSMATSIGFPLVSYLPSFGLLTAWTKEPNFRFRSRDLVHNKWALVLTAAVLLYTGVNTTLAVQGNVDTLLDPIVWVCLSVARTALAVFLKYILVDSQKGSSWISLQNPDERAAVDLEDVVSGQEQVSKSKEGL